MTAKKGGLGRGLGRGLDAMISDTAKPDRRTKLRKSLCTRKRIQKIRFLW